MTTKTWARVIDGVVRELCAYDAALVPGIHIPPIWADDVTAVSGIAVCWIRTAPGVFAAPPVDIAALQVAQGADIESACARAITGGFASSALGATHWYGSKTTDQANLDTDMMAAAQAAGGANVTADIMCSADNGATWSVATHSAAQIGTLWADFRAWRIACQAKKRTLQAQVAAATTPAAIAAIAWA